MYWVNRGRVCLMDTALTHLYRSLHLDQGRGSSKKESFSLRVSPALHPPERPSPRRADMAGHGHGSGNAGTEEITDIMEAGVIYL